MSAAAAEAVIAIAIPKRTQRREHSLDLLGATLLAIATSSFLVGLVWGGETHPWGSTQVLGAFAIALVSGTAFVFVERRAKEPILPFEFLRCDDPPQRVALDTLRQLDRDGRPRRERLGEANVVLAGGTENMSMAPHQIRGARWGLSLGEQKLEDYLWVALVDSYNGLGMANTAENLGRKYGITRQAADEFAYRSHMLAAKARALLEGRLYVSTEDVRAVAHPVLRHRIITTYGAEAEGYTSDRLIDDLLRTIPAKGETARAAIS